MQGEQLLINVIRFEAYKRTTVYALHAVWHASEAAVAAFADKIDEFYPTEEQPCSASILCLREGKRHRKVCPLNTNYSERCPQDDRFSCREVHSNV
jgi:hypothetical protein